MNDLERTYTPAEAAEEFNFAPSLLRRYAAIYEFQGGTIPTDKRGGRVYSAALLIHFSSARERVKSGEKVSEALQTIDLAPAMPVQDPVSSPDAQHLLSLLERVLSSNEALQQEVTELRVQVSALSQRQLEVPRTDSAGLSEQRRMNAYLLGELERRRLENEQRVLRRPWWRVWGRS